MFPYVRVINDVAKFIIITDFTVRPKSVLESQNQKKRCRAWDQHWVKHRFGLYHYEISVYKFCLCWASFIVFPTKAEVFFILSVALALFSYSCSFFSLLLAWQNSFWEEMNAYLGFWEAGVEMQIVLITDAYRGVAGLLPGQGPSPFEVTLFYCKSGPSLLPPVISQLQISLFPCRCFYSFWNPYLISTNYFLS